MSKSKISSTIIVFHGLQISTPSHRDVNGIVKNSLKMPGSRGRIGSGAVKGQRPCGGREKLNFHTSPA